MTKVLHIKLKYEKCKSIRCEITGCICCISEKKRFKCILCNKAYMYISWLNQHYKHNHNKKYYIKKK